MSSIELRIDIYSHNIMVSQISPRVKRTILDFCLSLGEHDIVKKARYDKSRGTMTYYYEKTLKRIYAAATADRSEFRFHINSYHDLIRDLAYNGIHEEHIDIVRHSCHHGVKIDLDFIDKRIPREEDQIPAIEYLVSDKKSKVLTLQTGKGKSLDMDALIKVPGGWKRNGDILVNDVVIAKDGTQSKVIGVYPQGIIETFKITFADGRSVICSGDHLWKVFYVNALPHKRWRIVNTFEISRLISMPNPRVYIDLIDPEETPDTILPIDPYVLGVFIGDGSSSSGYPSICSLDVSIIEEVEKRLTSNLIIKEYKTNDKCPIYGISDKTKGINSFNNSLKELNLYGKIHFEKFIPKSYLNSSKNQRLELLQGLMDTDGTANTLHTGGAISYSTVSKQLAEDVQYLIRSLGGIASISERYTNYTYKDEYKTGRLAYDVNIRYKKPSELFKLPRKIERTNDKNQYSENLKLRVKSIEYVGFKETQCIAIDHSEHLYITNDFIVTHNTMVFNHSLNKIRERCVIIIKGMYVQRWLDDLNECYKFKKGELMVVRGSKDLITLIELAKNNLLDAKIIIITNTTYRMFIDDYEINKSSNMYGCDPINFFSLVGAGIRLIDEVHQDFHLNFKIDLYTNIKTCMNLSATLKSDNQFLNKMYDLMFPVTTRANEFEYDKYIDVKAYVYYLLEPRKVKYQRRGRTSYSHVVFEESIMSSKSMMKNYCFMITDIIQRTFIVDYKAGQKIIVFCATVELCTKLTEYLKNMFIEFDVNRYVGEDDYSVMERSDIIVSTLKSAGTAVDIPDLKMALLTVAIGSRQANEQAVGRLRKLKRWPEMAPEFIYLVCQDVESHLVYHRHKQEVLSDKILSFKEYITAYKI